MIWSNFVGQHCGVLLDNLEIRRVSPDFDAAGYRFYKVKVRIRGNPPGLGRCGEHAALYRCFSASLRPWGRVLFSVVRVVSVCKTGRPSAAAVASATGSLGVWEAPELRNSPQAPQAIAPLPMAGGSPNGVLAANAASVVDFPP